ncbi:MAG: inactive transglutaminase family protein [Desulfobacterales bacterium]
MIRNNRGTIIIAILLTSLAGIIFFYKINYLELPLTSDQQVDLWNVEARITFDSPPGPAQVRVAIPQRTPGFQIMGEDFISGNYGLSVQTDEQNRYAHWTVRRIRGSQALYYRAQLRRVDKGSIFQNEDIPLPPKVPDYGEMEKAAAMAILEEARRSSADVATFVVQFLNNFNDPNPSENYRFFLRQGSTPIEKINIIMHILAGARVPSRVIQGVLLADGKRSLEITSWLQVHNGKTWLSFNPNTSEQGLPDNFLLWSIGQGPLLTAQGVSNLNINFSSSIISENMLRLIANSPISNRSFFLSYSFSNLPLHTQNLYKLLLLIPIGALLVVFSRNVIGIPTFGTFMPILIALAFKETNLGVGIILFLVIVTMGLVLRSVLDRMRLLLVPRLASVLILVIMTMAAISIISHKMGIPRGLSAALFPMVILAMTIERMSVVWEESGPGDAIGQGLGSLAVAVLAFGIFQNDLLEHLFFVFPELILVVLAACILLGRYTGYRASELIRFRTA